MKADIKGTLRVMKGFPVTIRLIDPPLHEFVPEKKNNKQVFQKFKNKFRGISKRANLLHENNPMMGHRGVRLGITYPEITETQVRAILKRPPNY